MLKHITLIVAAFFSVLSVGQAQIVITAVFDADLPGGLPKGVELYTTEDIADLSIFGIGSANNGGGSDSVEYTFPMMSVDAFSYLFVSSDSANFADFFGFNSDFPNVDAMLINGDDAVELFMDGNVIDVFGEIDMDGSGTAWEYKDGWAARKNATGPDGSAFDIQSWNFSGVGALDGEDTNAGAASPVPVLMYNDSTSGSDPDVTVLAQFLAFTPRDITIEVGQTVRWTNPETNVEHNVNGGKDVFPCNPLSFFSGIAAVGPWDYDVLFTQAGFYEYQCDPHVGLDMFGSVTVVDPDAPDYHVYDIATVTTVDFEGVTDSLDATCQLEGVVYGGNLIAGSLLFTIIDDTRNGISVFKGSGDCYDVTEGDRVIIQGTISQYNGLTQITPETKIQVLSSGNALWVPELIEGPILEKDESSIIKIKDAVTVDTVISLGNSGWIVIGTNSAGTYEVRMEANAFDEPGAMKGDVIVVTGIGGQFDPSLPYTEGYRIVPRGPEDIDIVLSTNFLPSSSITMFPNPVSDILYFETDLEIESVQVFNTSGALVATENEKRLNVSAMISGVYIVKVFTVEGVWTDRFVKVD